MVAERNYIDVEDDPNWAEIARAVHDSGDSVVVRAGGRKLAMLTPLPLAEGFADDDSIREIPESLRVAGRTPPSVSELSEEELKARWERFMSFAGSMKDVFADDFIEENYRQRLVRSRDWSSE